MSYVKIINNNTMTLYGVINYITDCNKTNINFIFGLGIDPNCAYDEMMLTKKVYDKTSGRQYKHFILSFDKDIPATYEDLLHISINVANFFSAQFQVLLALHFDKDNIHTHFIINTISPIDGKRLNLSKADGYVFKQYINTILVNNNLNPVELYDWIYTISN